MTVRGGEGSGAPVQLASCADVPGVRVACGRTATGVICGSAARTGGTQYELQASILASPLQSPQLFLPVSLIGLVMAMAMLMGPVGIVDRLRPRTTRIPSTKTKIDRFRRAFMPRHYGEEPEGVQAATAATGSARVSLAVRLSKSPSYAHRPLCSGQIASNTTQFRSLLPTVMPRTAFGVEMVGEKLDDVAVAHLPGTALHQHALGLALQRLQPGDARLHASSCCRAI